MSIRLDRSLILCMYLEEINRICDQNDEKSHFTAEEVVDILLSVVEKTLNPSEVDSKND